MSIQLGGNLMLGPPGSLVDYSNYVSQFTINTARETPETPATLGQPQTSKAAGARSDELVIQFYSSMAANQLWAELYDIISSDAAELGFSGNLEDAVTSADNPNFSGIAIVTSLATGPAVVGETRVQTVTYPVTSAGIVRDVTP